MPPRKLIHKSRPLGGKPRNSTPASERKTRKPRETKSDSAPKDKLDPLAVAASLASPTASNSNTATSTTPKQAQSYT